MNGATYEKENFFAPNEPGPNCENETSNYQLTLDRVMSSANCIEGKRFCKEDGMLLPVVESPQHLHTLARCLCPPDERIPHYKRPKGFHVRLRLPEGTTVNRWENITGGFRYICREFETWNVYLHTCPGNYTVYKCSVDCKFLVKKCNCLHINPNDTRNNSEEVMKQLMEAIFNELMLNATKLGKTARKRTSASDERPSATYAGYLGIAVLVVIAGAIVISDLPRLFKCPHCVWEEEKRARREKRKKREQEAIKKKEEEERKKKEEEERKKRVEERRARRRQVQVSAV
nr:hypothetical protein BaRGS_024014 [Batillaria attramentaria]